MSIYYCSNKSKKNLTNEEIQNLNGIPFQDHHTKFKLYENENAKKKANSLKGPSERINCTLAVLKFMGLIDNKTFEYWSERVH